MPDTVTSTVQTQPTTAAQPETTTAALDPAVASTEEAKAAVEAEKPQLVSDKYAKAAAELKRARTARREIDAQRAEAAKMMAEAKEEQRKAAEYREALKGKKGLELLRELGIDAEEHLSDVVINGKPDPLAEAAEMARKAEARAEALEKRWEEQEKQQKKGQQETRLRNTIEACADFVTKGAAIPHASALFSPDEMRQEIYKIHRQAESEGLALTFEQVGKVLEHNAKLAYDSWEQRRARLQPAQQTSVSGLKENRPVNTLTNEHASQSATVGKPEESRAERRKRLIAELEAGKTARQ